MGNENSNSMFDVWWQVSRPNCPFTISATPGQASKKACTLPLGPSGKFNPCKLALAPPPPDHNQDQASFLSLLSQASFQTCLEPIQLSPESFVMLHLCVPSQVVCMWHHQSWHLDLILGGDSSHLCNKTQPHGSRQKAVSTSAGQAGEGLLQRVAILYSSEGYEGVNRPRSCNWLQLE